MATTTPGAAEPDPGRGPGAARPRLEIAAQDVDGATAAVRHGAERLEVCQALAVGGLTPSLGLVEHAAALGVPVRPLIRPRAGGFRVSPDELRAMRRDVAALADAGAEAFVVGALVERPASEPSEGEPTEDELGLDVPALTALADAAAGRPVIVHRCADVLLGAGVAPEELVEQLIAAGAAGVLTSGGAADALAGSATLARLVRAAAGRLEIIAGGGVRPEALATLVDAGVDAVHLSASGPQSAGPSGPGGGEESFTTTDPQRVSAARAALETAPSSVD
ncbi:copper homeostasis protein CutC [Nesterenkonia sp. F]|uniref:copper homeostasis protein CutC n=1 Tax=Nesterenkonia sp. F TaxID=795955 RepID=UPI000255D33F|nr:copper homeostasis protein CutC [Nesterenkonia sp. F]